MAGLGVDVFDARELQAALLAFKILPAEINAQTRKHTKKLVDVEWQAGLAKRAKSKIQRRALVGTAVSSVTNSKVQMKSATKGRYGRVPASVVAAGAEFGANKELYTRYSRRSPGGGSHTVERRVMRHLSYRRPDGYVVYPTAKDLSPRIASMFVQTLIRTTAEAFDN
jgi:hypothetical protein